jgi:putative acetyltransferase
MTGTIEIREATAECDIAAVRSLWSEYWISLGFADDFQGFGEELRSLPGDYAPPRGLLLIASVGGAPAALGYLTAFALMSRVRVETKKVPS